MTTPRIYVADLAAYNAGHLHGIWIDATLDMDKIQEQIDKLLASSPVADCEEVAIHDYEGFGNYPLSEYESIPAVQQIACFIEAHDELGIGLLSNFGDLGEAEKALEEDYAGHYENVADFAEELTKETTEIPENLTFYIDYERIGQDLEYSGDIYTIQVSNREVHVFWNR